MTIVVFGVPLKGNPVPLAIGALLYVWATTSYGLVIATMTSSQVAATFATAIASVVPTIQFSGLLQPVSTLEGGAQTIGALWPSSYLSAPECRRLHQGAGLGGAGPRHPGAGLFRAGVHPDRGALAAGAGEVECSGSPAYSGLVSRR